MHQAAPVEDGERIGDLRPQLGELAWAPAAFRVESALRTPRQHQDRSLPGDGPVAFDRCRVAGELSEGSQLACHGGWARHGRRRAGGKFLHHHIAGQQGIVGQPHLAVAALPKWAERPQPIGEGPGGNGPSHAAEHRCCVMVVANRPRATHHLAMRSDARPDRSRLCGVRRFAGED